MRPQTGFGHLLAANILVTVGAFGVLARLDPEVAQTLFDGVPGANRLLPYLFGSLINLVVVLACRAFFERHLWLLSLAGALASLVALALPDIGAPGWASLGVYAVVFAALSTTWSLRIGLAERYASTVTAQRSPPYVIWVESSFAVAALAAFLMWSKDMAGIGTLDLALGTAAIAFGCGAIADYRSGSNAPISTADSSAITTVGGRHGWALARWVVALALFTVGVQMTITKISDHNVTLYLSFEFGTAVAGLATVLFVLRLRGVPFAASREKQPGFPVDMTVALGACLVLLGAAFSSDFLPSAGRWLALFMASAVYEMAFILAIGWLSKASTAAGYRNQAPNAKSLAVLLVVSCYWAVGMLTNPADDRGQSDVLLTVALFSLGLAAACVVPDSIPPTPPLGDRVPRRIWWPSWPFGRRPV